MRVEDVLNEDMPEPGYWMRGGCFAMAIALNKITKLPLYGLFDGNDLHHAFVYDEGNNIAIDSRGKNTLARLKAGSAGQQVKSVSVEDVMTAAGHIDPHYIRMAGKYIKNKLALG